jgi:hypothetical protein
MKAALFTGMFVLLLLAAPAETYALGLAEYGQEAAKADQPVLSLARLNGTLIPSGAGKPAWPPIPAGNWCRSSCGFPGSCSPAPCCRGTGWAGGRPANTW